jgi:aspartokinase/homoserine dehydrogenase 1
MVVVVSAMGETTDDLMRAGERAAAGDEGYSEQLEEIASRHIAVVRDLIPEVRHSHILSRIRKMLNDLEDLVHGIYLTRDLSAKTRDKLLGYGEDLSSYILSEVLLNDACPFTLLDSRELIRTDDTFGQGVVNMEITYKLLRRHIKKEKCYIMPGFISSTLNGVSTTLGRNGSDYTAALVAAALKADVLEIWTDVPGVMTADPRLVRQARPIESITYEEAMELSTFGARIIHPPAIQPLLREGIDVLILNTFEPDKPGTLITSEEPSEDHYVKGVAGIDRLMMLTLTGTSLAGSSGIAARLFRLLSHRPVDVVFLTHASSEYSISFGIPEDNLDKVITLIQEEFALELKYNRINPVEVETDLAMVAIVGNNMKRNIGLSGRVFSALGRNGINVVAIAQGSTERNLSVVIGRKDLKKAMNVLHESFFLSEYRKANLFIVGVGNVGKTLLKQLTAQREYLREEFSLDINLAGLANSRKMLLREEGIDLDRWEEELEKKGVETDINSFIDTIKAYNLRNSVFVDNTASEEIPAFYTELLDASISVVASNKIGTSAEYPVYIKNRNLARKRNVSLLFETNVGAGLPVIRTMNDLVQSGDRILRIEAVLSGTLNYIFNNFGPEKSFSETVREAMSKGLTEPDPSVDLKGDDVARKILILAREAGAVMNIEDVVREDFLPEECRKASTTEEFLDLLEKNNAVFDGIREEAEKEGKVLRFVAEYYEGQASIGLKKIDKMHPFYHLEGKDNILLLTTERYKSQPMVIRGAGAGAEVTAAGVFGDIIRTVHL